MTDEAGQQPPARGRVTMRDVGETIVAIFREWLPESALGRVSRRFVQRVGFPKLILGVSLIIWIAVFAVLVFNRHARFGSVGFDLGIFDQTIWLMSRGKGFITVRGLEIWGHHGSVGYYLFVPFYWFGAGPQFLNLAQVAVVSAGAIPIFAITRDLLKSEWLALVPSLAYMTHFSNQWFLQETFHPEVMAITPILLAYWAVRRGKWLQYGIWIAIAVSFKEDIAFAAAMFGLILVFRGHRKAGWWTVAGAALWFLFVSQILIPAFSSEGDFYGQFYTTLGDSPFEVAWNSLTNPTQVYRRLNEADLLGYVRDLSAPYAFTWLVAPAMVLIAVPQILFNLLTQQAFTWSTRLHYAAIPLAGFTLAAIEGLGRIKSQARMRFAVGAMAALSLASLISWGASPWSEDYTAGVWKLEENPKQDIFERAIAIPGENDVVSATYNIVPHLTHREFIYQFPNPFRASNWGVRDEDTHDPATVEWLVLDLPLLGPEDRVTFDEATATGWEIVFQEQAIVVLHRTP